MAEHDSTEAQERTEAATARRRAEAREKGQIPRSRELNTMVMLSAAALMLLAGGASLGEAMNSLLRENLALPRAALFDAAQTYAALRGATLEALVGLAPFLVVMAIAALAAPLALGGWVLNFELLAAQFDRLDPIKGLKRVFGWQGFA